MTVACVVLSQFDSRDEILKMAFSLKVDKFVPGKLVQADEFYDLLANASQLFRWWAQLQRVDSRIARKYFLDACQSIDKKHEGSSSQIYSVQRQG